MIDAADIAKVRKHVQAFRRSHPTGASMEQVVAYLMSFEKAFSDKFVADASQKKGDPLEWDISVHWNVCRICGAEYGIKEKCPNGH